MIYCEQDGVVVRDMELRDAEAITEGERAQGWRGEIEKYLTRLRDRDAGRCFALAAEIDGKAAGYIHLYFEPQGGPYRGIPEIVDFGVLEKHRRQGVGSLLMDAAESLARRRSGEVCLGVGLHSGYGSAQRMYAKRGYVPDGSGVWYRNAPCAPYGPCANDDDLVLYMKKAL